MGSPQRLSWGGIPAVTQSDNEHGQEGPTASKPLFLLIQALRGLAALMVVAHHSSILVLERLHLGYNWVNGGSGVDLFFVISGFVMTISSKPLQDAPHPARTFLARRLERIVPMYWIVTLARVATLLLWPHSGRNDIGNWQHVVSSLLFVPSVSLHVVQEPILLVGWSLNFEMAFYLLFALALFLRRPPLWLVGAPLAFAAVIDLLGVPASQPWVAYYRRSILLEFAGGMLLAHLLPQLRKVPWWAALGVVLLAFRPLWFFQEPTILSMRGLVWGVPAVAVVGGILSLEHRWGRYVPRWALRIGDASYSIYLVHTFVLPAVGLLLVHLRHSWRYEVTMLIAISVVLSSLTGVLAYEGIERPINKWFRGRRRTAVPVTG